MGLSALIAANGADSDQYYVSANFFHSAKETFCFHLLVRYADYTQEKKEPFYLSCSWTWVLLTGPGKETASGNGSLFKWHLSAFVLRQRSAYLSKRSDLRRLRCSTNHWSHPAVPDRVTRLQQHVKCVHALFLVLFFFFLNILLCRVFNLAVFFVF